MLLGCESPARTQLARCGCLRFDAVYIYQIVIIVITINMIIVIMCIRALTESLHRWTKDRSKECYNRGTKAQ